MERFDLYLFNQYIDGFELLEGLTLPEIHETLIEAYNIGLWSKYTIYDRQYQALIKAASIKQKARILIEAMEFAKNHDFWEGA